MNYRRRELVREIILSKPFTSLKELEELFPNVSSMTLRRDIEYCEAQGDAVKVRGGAKSMKFITTSMEDPIYNRMNSNVSVKKRIAKRRRNSLSRVVPYLWIPAQPASSWLSSCRICASPLPPQAPMWR